MNEHEQKPSRQTSDTVIGLLDLGTRQMEAETLARLYTGRRQAVSSIQARHAGQGTLALTRHPWLLGLALAASLFAAIWLGLRQPPAQTEPIPDTSELDIQLLTGEVPPQVFADWGLVNQENVEDICFADS